MVVVLDANVLYPAPLRDLLLSLAAVKLFQPKWSVRINDEWTRNLVKNRPDISPEALAKTITAMNIAFPDALMPEDPTVEAQLHLPDPDDRHVLMTALISEADYIVTANTKDFPAMIAVEYRIEPIHPDDFVTAIINEHPGEVRTAVDKIITRLKNPRKTFEEVMQTLLKCGMPRTVAALQQPQDQEYEKVDK